MSTVANDITNRKPLGISSVPAGIDPVLEGNATVLAGNKVSFIVTTTPDSPVLSLWNFLYSIVIDSLVVDSSELYEYLYPNGSGWTQSSAAYKNTRITDRVDWASSSDTTNKRNHVITIENNDSSSHIYYLFYKAYTFDFTPGIAT